MIRVGKNLSPNTVYVEAYSGVGSGIIAKKCKGHQYELLFLFR
jgi:hypothetical protein